MQSGHRGPAAKRKLTLCFRTLAVPLFPSFLVLQSTKDGMTYLRRSGSLELGVLTLLHGTATARPTTYVHS